jgi:hypothetical protein
MTTFLQQLRDRNETLFYFGLLCLAASIIFLILTRTSGVQVNNVSAWYKPFKFSFSTLLFAWSMAWYCSYLNNFNIKLFNWSVIALLGFEIIYIAVQAGRGQLSHFNLTTPFYAAMYSLMALAATAVTIYAAYVCFLFFQGSFPELPSYYVWAIRFGLLLFVIFSFQGFMMGSKLTHTVGGADGTAGIFLLNWSFSHGDLRIAHFVGMHALQILPVMAYYLLKNNQAIFVLAFIYLLLAMLVLIQALQGRPLIKG